MKQSIEQIKQYFQDHPLLTDDKLAELANDERKGVQTLLTRYNKEQAKKQALVDRFERMSEFEKIAWSKGAQAVAGIDEVGRGPLAGPVVAAAVILTPAGQFLGLNDSKQVPEAQREALFQAISEQAIAIGIGIISPQCIDEVNIYEASKLAMMEAIEHLSTPADYLLIDAMTLPINLPQEKLIKGDARSNSIAAASIIAKVTRDRMMKQYAIEYPGYDFEHNAGYGTAKHLAGLKANGITPIHRKSFAPVKNYC